MMVYLCTYSLRLRTVSLHLTSRFVPDADTVNRARTRTLKLASCRAPVAREKHQGTTTPVNVVIPKRAIPCLRGPQTPRSLTVTPRPESSVSRPQTDLVIRLAGGLQVSAYRPGGGHGATRDPLLARLGRSLLGPAPRSFQGGSPSGVSGRLQSRGGSASMIT